AARGDLEIRLTAGPPLHGHPRPDQRSVVLEIRLAVGVGAGQARAERRKLFLGYRDEIDFYVEPVAQRREHGKPSQPNRVCNTWDERDQQRYQPCLDVEL